VDLGILSLRHPEFDRLLQVEKENQSKNKDLMSFLMGMRDLARAGSIHQQDPEETKKFARRAAKSFNRVRAGAGTDRFCGLPLPFLITFAQAVSQNGWQYEHLFLIPR